MKLYEDAQAKPVLEDVSEVDMAATAADWSGNHAVSLQCPTCEAAKGQVTLLVLVRAAD